MADSIYQSGRRVPGKGPQNAKIAIVGEAPGAAEDIRLEPFVGPAGGVLDECLRSAGLIRNDIYLTNVVKMRPRSNDISPFFSSRSGTFSAVGLEWVRELREELDALRPNIVVAAGKTALAALTGQTKISRFRGYLMETIELQNVRKCLPCIHPAACLWKAKNDLSGDKGSLSTASASQYLNRYVITNDLKKAAQFSHVPEMERPDRTLVYRYDSVEEALEWIDYFVDQPIVSFDIEVVNYEVSCVGFSSDPKVAASIPIHYSWSDLDEVRIWRGIQRVLGNPNSIKVGQNLIFDTHFLLTRCGIEVLGPIQDSMIAHHIIYPDLPKGLEFLGSLYCGSQAYWKDMVKWDNIKDEA